VDRSNLEGKCIELFRAAIKSPHTRDPYERRLVAFLDWYGKDCDAFVKDAKLKASTVELKLIKFIQEKKVLVEKKLYAGSTIAGYLKSIRLLLDMNDVVLNWKKVRRTLPPQRRFAQDRICTIDEIRKILINSDNRIRALTLVMLSSGIREGAVEYLKVKHLTPIEIDGEIVAGKLNVYAGEAEEYISFITREAYEAVQEYLQFRELHEDHVTDQSPLFRDKFDSLTSSHYTHYSSVVRDNPKPMNSYTINKDYNRLFYRLGFRVEKKRRHEFTVHGFRKWFKTTSERAGMRPIDVETLIGHSTGVSDSYYRPTETDLLNSYLAIAHHLTISEVEQKKREMVEQDKRHQVDTAELFSLVRDLSSEVKLLKSQGHEANIAVAEATRPNPRDK